MTADPPLVFRISWVRPWLLAAVILAVPAAVAALATVARGGRATALLGIVAGWAVASAVVLVPIALTARTSRWDLDGAGIGGRDNWHVYRRVAWPEIRSVSPLRIPGYRLVHVNTATRRKAIWVPLFLDDMASFRAAVRRYAAADNPLRRFLEEHAEGRQARRGAAPTGPARPASNGSS